MSFRKPASGSLVLLLAIWSCTSTETGNPHSGDPPDQEDFVTVKLGVQLFRDPNAVGISSTSAAITGLHLRISEVQITTCDGQSFLRAAGDLDGDLARSPEAELLIPSGPLCGFLVRTLPLSVALDSTLPAEVDGAGALITGRDEEGADFSIALPPQVLSVLAPTNPEGVVLDFEELTISLDEVHLLETFLPYVQNTTGLVFPAPKDSFEAPVVGQFEEAFSLRPLGSASLNPLFEPVLTPLEDPELHCTSLCSQDAQLSCQTGCDAEVCRAQLLDPDCGSAFSRALSCELGLDQTQLRCSDGARIATVRYCDSLKSEAETCQGAVQ